MSFKIVCDTSSDLSINEIKKFDIDAVPFYISFDGANYKKEMDEMSTEEFYNKLIEQKLFSKTSMPTIQDYIEVFEKNLREEKDIICICISSKLSGSYSSAINAKNILSEQYPDRKITVIDSSLATGSEYLFIRQLINMKNKGFSYEEIIEKLDKIKETGKVYFTVDSLDHLKYGGRIGKASALAGTLLNIKPIIIVKEGELFPGNKVRGHKKALQFIIDTVKEDLGEEKDKYDVCLITISRNDSVEFIRHEFAKSGLKFLNNTVMVGSTIGSHVGPTIVGVCYIKKYEYV